MTPTTSLEPAFVEVNRPHLVLTHTGIELSFETVETTLGGTARMADGEIFVRVAEHAPAPDGLWATWTVLVYEAADDMLRADGDTRVKVGDNPPPELLRRLAVSMAGFLTSCKSDATDEEPRSEKELAEVMVTALRGVGLDAEVIPTGGNCWAARVDPQALGLPEGGEVILTNPFGEGWSWTSSLHCEPVGQGHWPGEVKAGEVARRLRTGDLGVMD
ncbi:hypothetical protein [Embleya sp. NBC_00896]|uniref:hypothetical protein n=1 Tax=Embleya sp. NBC_00896 TaxID=2975961 RepID=UPI002F90F290|nr:hypothetical protein OG928_48570 [Embleya sp. NBC_00896]